MFGRFSSQFREHLLPLAQVGWGAAKFFAVMHLTFDYVFDITLVKPLLHLLACCCLGVNAPFGLLLMRFWFGCSA